MPRTGNVGRQLLDDGVVEALDVLEHVLVLARHEVDSDTLATEPAAATDTVQVVLWLRRQVEVDDQRHLQCSIEVWSEEAVISLAAIADGQ